MPAATAEARPAMPTVRRHAEGCPERASRQEVFEETFPSTHRQHPGERTGVARCRDCGVSELVDYERVASYRRSLLKEETDA